MNIVGLGTSEFIVQCLRGMAESGHQVRALVSLPRHRRPQNSIDVSEFARERGIAYAEVEDVNRPESVATLRSFEPDVLVVAWPQLLRKAALEVPRVCCIGSHPTDLPFNRGRHPLHWLMVLGYRESKLTFFRIDEGTDSGPILAQVPFTIDPEDTIGQVVAKVNGAAYVGASQLGRTLTAALPDGVAQEESRANYWRKRTPHDVTLDPRLSAEMIVRTVRSFTVPYTCAQLLFGEHAIPIVGAVVVQWDATEEMKRLEPGRIVEIAGRRIRMKAGDAVIDLMCQDAVPQAMLGAKYIHPPTKYLAEHGPVLAGRLEATVESHARSVSMSEAL